MSKPTSDMVARMLGADRAVEVPAGAGVAPYAPCDKKCGPFSMHCVRPSDHDGKCTVFIMEAPELIAVDRGAAPAPSLNRDQSVAVSPTYTYNEDMTQAPRGVKLILLGQGGVAQLAEYHGDPFWIGWAALPRRAGGVS